MIRLTLFIVLISFLNATADELPRAGFRAVSGGASPDGRWLISVLDSSVAEFIDQLPESHHSPYLINIDQLKPVHRITDIDTLGGLHGRPESNVTAKWFPDSKHVSISWRQGRLNHAFRIFTLTDDITLEKIILADPTKVEGSLFNSIEANSNAGHYLQSITHDGKLIVVYYGFLIKNDAVLEAETRRTFDYNRIEVIYSMVEGEWQVESIASPGEHQPE